MIIYSRNVLLRQAGQCNLYDDKLLIACARAPVSIVRGVHRIMLCCWKTVRQRLWPYLFRVTKRRPFGWIVNRGKTKKSQGLKSGEYGGRGDTGMLLVAKSRLAEIAVWNYFRADFPHLQIVGRNLTNGGASQSQLFSDRFDRRPTIRSDKIPGGTLTMFSRHFLQMVPPTEYAVNHLKTWALQRTQSPYGRWSFL